MSRSRAALPVLALLTLAACGPSRDAPASSVLASSAPAPPRSIATPTPTPEPSGAEASEDPPAPPSVASPTASEPVRVDPPWVSANAAEACEDLQRVAGSHVPELTRCFDAESATTPELFAILDVRLVLLANGTVESVTRASAIYPRRFEDAVTRLERCVHASVRTWTFATSVRPASVVTYAIDFDRRVHEPMVDLSGSLYATGEGTVGLGNLGVPSADAPHQCQPL